MSSHLNIMPQILFNSFFLVSQLTQLSITMGTVRQVVITPRMSSTLVLTAGCALTTRRWRSSTSTTWWSRLQSAPPTCCTTAVSTCCRHAHIPTYTQIFRRIHKHNTYMLRLLSLKVQYIHTWHKHTKLMNRNTAQLVLLQDFPISSYPVPAFLRASFSSTLLLVSFFHFRRRETSCIHNCFPVTALFSLHHCCVFVLFFGLSFKAASKDCWIDGGWVEVTG